MRWIWNIGVVLVSSAMRSSRSLGWGSAAAGDAKGGDRRRGRGRGLSRAGQERLEAAAAVERDQFVAAADVSLADEDLRHRPAACQLDHRLALGGLLVDADLIDGLDAALLQERFRAYAVRAGRRAVHLDGLHRLG